MYSVVDTDNRNQVNSIKSTIKANDITLCAIVAYF